MLTEASGRRICTRAQAVIHASAQGLQQGRGASTCPSLPSPILRATSAAGGAGLGDTGGWRELCLVRQSPSALSMSGTRCVWSLSREPLCSFAHRLLLLGICGLETWGSQPLVGMPRDPVSAFQPSGPRESSRLWPGLSSGMCKARVWSGAGLPRCRGISGLCTLGGRDSCGGLYALRAALIYMIMSARTFHLPFVICRCRRTLPFGGSLTHRVSESGGNPGLPLRPSPGQVPVCRFVHLSAAVVRIPPPTFPAFPPGQPGQWGLS